MTPEERALEELVRLSEELGLYDQEIHMSYKTLDSIYEEMPDRRELLWEYVGIGDYLNTGFKVVRVSPASIMNWTLGDTTIGEAFKKASAEQKELVEFYRSGLNEAKDSYLVIHGNTLVDGHHRAVALAKNNVKSVRALDLSRPKED